MKYLKYILYSCLSLMLLTTLTGCSSEEEIGIHNLSYAGPDQHVSTTSTVQLSSTYDTLPRETYTWKFLSKPSGSNAQLSDSSSKNPTFIADLDGIYKLQLKIKVPDISIVTSNFYFSEVTITASSSNIAPVAKAGDDQNIATGSTVSLDASSSFDANSDTLTYAWSITSKPGGSTGVLLDSTASNPSFIADINGSYTIELLVNDGTTDSAPDTLVVQASKPYIVGAVDTQGNAEGIAVVGNYAYVADGQEGLQIIDISNPTTPNIVANVDSSAIELPANDVNSHYTKDVSILGSYAYLADSHAGLQIVDISNPLSASIVANVNTPGQAVGVSVVGDYAYIADWNEGLQIVDISNPLSPAIIKAVAMPNDAHDVTVVGNYAYVAAGNSGLQIVDINNPASASIVASANTGSADDIAISGSYAYVAAGSSLQIVNLSNPLSPVIVANVTTSGYAANGAEVSVLGNYAFVANGYVDDGNPNLHVIDISDPTTPAVVDNINTPSYAYGLAVSGSYIYVADFEAGLQIVDMGPYKVQ